MRIPLLVIAISIAAIASGGCALFRPDPLREPVIRAADTMAPEYIEYVEADEELSESEQRIRVENARSLIRLGEELKGNDP